MREVNTFLGGLIKKYLSIRKAFIRDTLVHYNKIGQG